MTTTAHAAPTPDIDDELMTQIITRRRNRTPLLTLALVVAVAAAAAFVGGTEVQKHYGTSSSSGSSTGGANLASLAARFGRTGGAGGFFGSRGGAGSAGGAPGFGGGATIGTVTLIKGSQLYVTDSSGTTSIVNAGSATVTKSVRTSLRSISPGSVVTVVGTQNASGTTVARSITVNGNG